MKRLQSFLLLAIVCSITTAVFGQDLNEALWEAAKENDAAKIQSLLDQGVDVNAKNKYGATALTFAADRTNYEAAKVLIENGADVNAKDTFYNATPLQWVAYKGHAGITRMMLENGADLSNDTPIQWAAFSGNTEIVLMMLEYGANQGSALMAAVRSGNTELVSSILHAAKFETENLSQPLATAVNAENEEITKMLEGAGATLPEDFKKKNREEETEPEVTLSAEDVLEEGAGVETPANWPSFRGSHASGVADGQYPPTVWNAETGLNIRWKTAIPGLAHSSPVIWNDYMFLTTAISGDTTAEYRVGLYGDVGAANDNSVHSWRIYCLNKRSGDVVWEKTAYEGVPRVKRHTKGTQANSTPVTNGDVVVALFGSEGLFCYDMDGNLLWQTDLGRLDGGWFYDAGYEWGHASSPIIHNNTVIVQCDKHEDSYIAAYDLKTGESVWRTSRDEIPSWGTPTLVETKDRTEVVTNAAGYVRGYDADTGNELWKLVMNSEVNVATPVLYDDIVYVTSGYAPNRPVFAIKPGGSGDLTLPDSLDSGDNILWRKKRDGTYMPTPIAYGGYLYTLANNGVVICYDAKTGEQQYKVRVAGRGGVAFTASPVAADGRIFFTGEDGDIYVVKAGPKFERIAINKIGEICMASPAISDGMIFIRSQHHIYGIGRSEL